MKVTRKLASTIGFIVLLASLATIHIQAQQKALVKSPLKLIRTIPMPKIDGDFDHFAADIKGNRLFLASEDDKSVEVFDLQSGKMIHRITGFDTPHSILYLPEKNELYVIDGGDDGACKVLRGDNYEPIKTIKLSPDADPMAYDAETHRLYVGNGGKDAKNDYSLVSIIDTDKGEKLGDIKVEAANLESMAVERSGSRLFVNARDKNQIAVLDTEKQVVIATWALKNITNNTPMILDPPHHRLFIAGRKPGRLDVLDTQTGKEIASLAAGEGVDDMSFDPATKRIYLSCADGVVNIYQQKDPDHYNPIGKATTGYRGKTMLLVPSLHRLYVATSKNGKVPAKLFIFSVN